MGENAIISIVHETVVHRLGGGDVDNLRLSRLEEKLNPPGISVLLGGTAQDAAMQMRAAFPGSRKWNQMLLVGTSTVAAIRAAGFDLIPDSTARFPNHARLIHPQGIDGFTEENLAKLSPVFHNQTGC